MEQYTKWVEDKLLDTYIVSLASCALATLEMQKDFPELTRVCGQVKGTDFYGNAEAYEHWWLKTNHGVIVDPTVAQFMNLTNLCYHEALGVPTGKCPNCGGLCYENSFLCSLKCEKEYYYYVIGIDD